MHRRTYDAIYARLDGLERQANRRRIELAGHSHGAFADVDSIINARCFMREKTTFLEVIRHALASIIDTGWPVRMACSHVCSTLRTRSPSAESDVGRAPSAMLLRK